MKDKKKALHYNFTISHALWLLIPHYIFWQLEARDKALKTEHSRTIHALNLSLLLNLNSMVEGYMEDLLSAKIKQYHLDRISSCEIEEPKNKDNQLFEARLINKLTNEIDKNTWNKLLENFELLFGEKVAHFVEPEIWKSMSCQFSLRNMIAHGNTIAVSFKYDESGDVTMEWSKKYQKVYNYFREKGLIGELNPRNLDLMSLFEVGTVDHLLVNSIKFIEQLNVAKKNNFFLTINSSNIERELEPIKKRFNLH